ncbi:hypothetical protein [Streptomyces sp. NPDC001297]|uniref:hypothetical protein n=1 Tax=Streptomyces sp. NPDC001297 TaxID=3364559 RepID=UPI003674B31A
MDTPPTIHTVITIPETVLTAPWPAGVVGRYLARAGATVDIRSNLGNHVYASCTGCDWTDHNVDYYTRQKAQEHAERCLGIPLPATS